MISVPKVLLINAIAAAATLEAAAAAAAAFQPASARQGSRPSSAVFSGRDDTPFFATSATEESIGKGVRGKQQNEPSPDESGFGQSVPYVPPIQRTQQSASTIPLSPNKDKSKDESLLLRNNRTRSILVALASFTLSILHYWWQLSHPVTAISILADMQSRSAPLASIANGKPTVIDFWAPWCENCKASAPTLRSVEEEYRDRVNFLMVNADDGRNWPLVELFGVDAIPHLAFVSGEGDVETALIGPVSRRVLRADIDAMLRRGDCGGESGMGEGNAVVEESPPTQTWGDVCHEQLPFKMYDAFGSRPESRRIKFVEQWVSFLAHSDLSVADEISRGMCEAISDKVEVASFQA